MNISNRLTKEIEICDLHSDRLRMAMQHMETLFPLTPEKWEDLKPEDLGFLELMTSRFAKLQDTMGRKVFPLLLESLGEHEKNDSFIDNLNKLEKLEILPDVNFWNRMREVRNEIAHDYPENPDEKIAKIRDCFQASQELLSFWEDLKKTMITRVPALKK